MVRTIHRSNDFRFLVSAEYTAMAIVKLETISSAVFSVPAQMCSVWLPATNAG